MSKKTAAADAFRLASKFDDQESDTVAALSDSPFYSYLFAREIKKGRWEGVERSLDLIALLMYARDVVKGRWEEAEPIIAKDPVASLLYAEDCLKGRFELGEDSIASSPFLLSKYTELLGGRLPEKLHSVVALMSFESDENWIKEYFKKNDRPNG